MTFWGIIGIIIIFGIINKKSSNHDEFYREHEWKVDPDLWSND